MCPILFLGSKWCHHLGHFPLKVLRCEMSVCDDIAPSVFNASFATGQSHFCKWYPYVTSHLTSKPWCFLLLLFVFFSSFISYSPYSMNLFMVYFPSCYTRLLSAPSQMVRWPFCPHSIQVPDYSLRSVSPHCCNITRRMVDEFRIQCFFFSFLQFTFNWIMDFQGTEITVHYYVVYAL